MLKQEGGKLVDESIEFNNYVEKLYNTVNQLVESGYISSSAKAIPMILKNIILI